MVKWTNPIEEAGMGKITGCERALCPSRKGRPETEWWGRTLIGSLGRLVCRIGCCSQGKAVVLTCSFTARQIHFRTVLLPNTTQHSDVL